MSQAPGAPILVTFQQIADAVQQTQATSSNMNAKLDELKSGLSQMKSIWQGQASDDYKSLQDQWDKAVAALNLIMAEISKSLNTALTNYHATEDANAKVWKA
jgi:WXG100 family type VII secretion target